MGGRETVRGIFIQALICCKEMFNKKWQTVKFEPQYNYLDSSSKQIDKIDILFLNDNNQIYALQVKSSINEFTVSKVKNWIKEMQNDIVANFYELHLVGDCDYRAKEYISKINETYNLKVICTSFNIENIEKIILDNLKDFLKENNIWYKDEILKNNIKILYYELTKNALDDKIISTDDIIKLLTSINNSDIRDFCKLIRDRLSKRIETILDFYFNTYSLFGFGSDESKKELQKSIAKILEIDKEFEVQIEKPLKAIENTEQFYSFLCNEYLLREKEAIKIFLDDLNTPQNYYHKKHSMIYHLKLRNEINKLIRNYNEIDDIISKKYDFPINKKKLFDNQDNIIIKYSKAEELDRILCNLEIAEKKYSRVVTFTDDESKFRCAKENIVDCNTIMLLNEFFTQEKMLEQIIFLNEAFTEDGSFGPQLYMRYIIFLLNVSDNIKEKLEEFKSRSTIKYIFIEQKNNIDIYS